MTAEGKLRSEIKYLQAELASCREDRQKFRDYFSGKLRYFITLLADKRYTPSAWMVEDLAKLFQRVQWFSW